VNPLLVEIETPAKICESKLRVAAVDGIDLQLKQGGVFGLLGPNGAGKTTTISVATTRTQPSSETVRIAGIDLPPLVDHYFRPAMFTEGMSRLGFRGFLKRVLAWNHKKEMCAETALGCHILEPRVSYKL
jgi:ABC-type uncharacterized transport system ATPase subunit